VRIRSLAGDQSGYSGFLPRPEIIGTGELASL